MEKDPQIEMIDQSQEIVVPPGPALVEASISSDVSYSSEKDKPNESNPPQSEKQTLNTSNNEPSPLQKRMLQHKELFATESKSNKLNYYMCDMQTYFRENKLRRGLDQAYRFHSIIDNKDEDRIRFKTIFQEMENNKIFSPQPLNLTLRESRGIAAVLGMAIGDALGSCTQFHHFNKKGLNIVKTGFADLLAKFNRSGKVTVWTDDASMGLCMADSILLNDYKFNPTHMRYMFILWLEHGLNNGGRQYSIGLGGNISISMYEFMRNQREYTETGDRFNNGNGSLMRLAPVPVAYSHNLEEGIKNSGNQSLTTHNGVEAEECAKLMGNIIIELINRGEHEDGKQVIDRVCKAFTSPAKSVEFLARSQIESEEYYLKCCQNPKFKTFNKQRQDRNWNWKDQSFTYAPTRLHQQPGYIGSYCMDALAMALHTVWFNNSFADVVIKNADMGGDCDTVGSIAGQIAGAIYGIDARMLKLYSEMEDYTEGRFEVFLKGYKLINRKTI